MIVRFILAALILAIAARLMQQGLHSYRDRHVRLSLFLRDRIQRQSQPLLYWSALAVHIALTLTFLGIAASLILD